MAFKYETVVPWGRSYGEYVDMFHITDNEMGLSFLGCGDGPASFNSIMTKHERKVVSADPIYHLTATEIRRRIEETYENVISQTRNNRELFVWTKIKNVDELGEIRMSAMNEFLDDYEKGKDEKRYIAAELPDLPFRDGEFDMALSSHFLFLYTDNLSLDFHIKSIVEMLRAAKEARIFPLLDVNGRKSPYVDKVKEYFNGKNVISDEIRVNYEFQKGGDRMLRLIRD